MSKRSRKKSGRKPGPKKAQKALGPGKLHAPDRSDHQSADLPIQVSANVAPQGGEAGSFQGVELDSCPNNMSLTPEILADHTLQGDARELVLPPAILPSDDDSVMLARSINSSLQAEPAIPATSAVEPNVSVPAKPRSRFWQKLLLALLLALSSGVLVGYEFKTSYWQSVIFSKVVKKMTFHLGVGASASFPQFEGGPYDKRLGYSAIPAFSDRLTASGFTISHQARVSPEHTQLMRFGAFPIYNEKSQSGLWVVDRSEQPMSIDRYPESIYTTFSEIPKIVADTLLFIEDRKLLDEREPRRNPTLDWERLVKAGLDFAKSQFTPGHPVPGGSTLATQSEKFRHSPQGITHSPMEKFRQMLSATLRTYAAGPYTLGQRQEILRNYINSVPLAALPGFGEVNGLADGLWAYYGRTLDQMNRVLSAEFSQADPDLLAEQGIAYRQVLSLFLAHRRPSELLRGDPELLNERVGIYLKLLHRAGVVPTPLFQAAKNAEIAPRRILPKVDDSSFLARKGQNLVRTHLLQLLGMERLYDLDRIDLLVQTTLDNEVQTAVTKVLTRLKDPDHVSELGLVADRMLSSRGQLQKVIYSFTLFETDGKQNKLRVQTDNFDQPFNINEGTKLDLGSTAKLRTLITYLEVIEELFHRYSGSSKRTLERAKQSDSDPLSQWALNYFLARQDSAIELRDMLEQAMNRTYSANPGERFFTAGGVHTFSNFNKDDNGKVVTMSHAMRQSINLPFIRVMRDISLYYQFHTTGSTARTLQTLEDLSRRDYLARFADKEGKVFLKRFFDKYSGKTPERILEVLLDGVEYRPRRFASIYWILHPKAQFDEFAAFMRESFAGKEPSDKELQSLWGMYDKQQFSLADKGYIARVHPLELWLAAYLYQRPDATLSEMYDASTGVRQEVYGWLFSSKRKVAQDKRIRTMIEAESFIEIHRKWRALGYPLDSLVPSYATALGTSADRPSALAELMGIIVNGGRRLPTARIERLEFAKDTPFASYFVPKSGTPEQVLNPIIAEIIKSTLLDVVENGTAVRLKGGIKTSEGSFLVGGKTGTGDHRFQVFAKGGRLQQSRVVNRTATFVFFIDDRFFGTITALVRGSDAEKFKFTSSLPVQLVKMLGSELEPLLLSDVEEQGRMIPEAVYEPAPIDS